MFLAEGLFLLREEGFEAEEELLEVVAEGEFGTKKVGARFGAAEELLEDVEWEREGATTVEVLADVERGRGSLDGEVK